LALTLTKQKRFEYLGQVNMLALTTILLLIPLLLLNKFYIIEWVNTIYLISLAKFIFKEYIRRMDFAGVLIKNKWLVSLNLLSLTGFLFFLIH